MKRFVYPLIVEFKPLELQKIESTFESEAPRYLKEQSFLGGSQATPVCPPGKRNA